MRIWQWLIFATQLPRFAALARRAEKLNYHERFALLQKACQQLLRSLRVELRVQAPQHLNPQQAYYLVSNHQGTFDPILLVAGAPLAHSFISKVENLKLPVIGTWGRLIEFITFKREDRSDNVTMLRQATRALQSGRSLLVFPEGTRSKSNTLLPFKSGALLPAYMAKVPILPLALTHAATLKDTPTIHLVYGEPIPFQDYQTLSYEELSERLEKTLTQLQVLP
jgi:1-acyl-sn-glycerol-3-phosphate acyltransferase